MDNLEGLVSRLSEIKELYRAEEFRVLAEFLKSLRDEFYVQLIDTEAKAENLPLIASLQEKYKLASTLYDLPQLVEGVKARLEAFKALQEKQKRQSED